MADTHYYTKGIFDGEEVFFASPSKNDTGALSDRKEKVSKTNIANDTVWVTNTHGVTSPMGLTTAKYLVNRAGRKFRYATEEEIPYVPKEKIRPYDHNKEVHAQENSNVELTGRQVKEMVEEGIDPLEGVVSYKEMRAIAKENGIKTHAMKKKDLAAKLREAGLIE